ncbi:short-chain oxidoreductase [Hysterangium stoloniferum]|nr:short-chain oxidoreductase [Hysterangium stoloniferum]
MPVGTEYSSTFSGRRVWFITGTSSGLGRCLALNALSRGDKVIATARDITKIEDLVLHGAHAMQLDVRDDFSIIARKAAEAIEIYGCVDVVVNNAGYGMFGALEEVGQVRPFFSMTYKTNVFGVINVTHAFLAHMRERRNGTIVVVGSRSGWKTQSAVRPYGSSKAAVHAIAESLMEELRPLGIRVLLVQPGGFRTEMITNSELKLGNMVVSQYLPFHLLCAKALAGVHGCQPGDPRKAVDVIVDVVRGEGCAVGKRWPDLLVLGEDAEEDIRSKCQQVLARLDDAEWRDIVRGVGI